MLLALDTAGPACAVAIARLRGGETEILARAEERLGRGHSERLIPMIDAALREAGIAYGSLLRIATTIGPGSFTGVRVGVAAARGLALALGIPAVGVGSLDALAQPARRRTGGTLVAALDARRGEVYALVEDVASGALLAGPLAVSPEALAATLAAPARPLVLTGSGAPLVAPLLPEYGTEILGTADHPDIADVAILGYAGNASQAPLPLYIRGADAKPQAGAVARL
jgi:tRNA threonylcarbamoyladenosine biosynthesis protein TsaB